MSAEPDKQQTPVSRGERIAAALVVAALVGWIVYAHFDPSDWWLTVRTTFWQMRNGWTAFFRTAPNFPRLVSSDHALTGVASSCYLAFALGMPVLVSWASLFAGGWCHRWRVFFWWLVLLHGLVILSAQMVSARFDEVFMSGRWTAAAPPHWNAGWLDYFWRGATGESVPFTVVALTELLLAAAVLWFTRRRKGGAQAHSPPA